MQSAFLNFLNGLEAQKQKNIDRQIEVNKNNVRNMLLFKANQRADEEYKQKQNDRKANELFNKAYLNPDARDINKLLPQTEWNKAALTPEEVKVTQGVDITNTDALKKAGISGDMLADIMHKAKAQTNISNSADVIATDPKYGITELNRNMQAARKVADAGLSVTPDIVKKIQEARAAQIAATNSEKNSLSKQLGAYTKNIDTDMRSLLKSNGNSNGGKSNIKGMYYRDVNTGQTIFVPKNVTSKENTEPLADTIDKLTKKISPRGVGIDASNLRDLVEKMQRNNYSDSRIKYLLNANLEEGAGGFGLNSTKLGVGALKRADEEYLRMHPEEDTMHHYVPITNTNSNNNQGYQRYIAKDIVENKNKIQTIAKKLEMLNTNPAEAKRNAAKNLLLNALNPIKNSYNVNNNSNNSNSNSNSNNSKITLEPNLLTNVGASADRLLEVLNTQKTTNQDGSTTTVNSMPIKSLEEGKKETQNELMQLINTYKNTTNKDEQKQLFKKIQELRKNLNTDTDKPSIKYGDQLHKDAKRLQDELKITDDKRVNRLLWLLNRHKNK